MGAGDEGLGAGRSEAVARPKLGAVVAAAKGSAPGSRSPTTASVLAALADNFAQFALDLNLERRPSGPLPQKR